MWNNWEQPRTSQNNMNNMEQLGIQFQAIMQVLLGVIDNLLKFLAGDYNVRLSQSQA